MADNRKRYNDDLKAVQAYFSLFEVIFNYILLRSSSKIAIRYFNILHILIPISILPIKIISIKIPNYYIFYLIEHHSSLFN
ncbi:hypothetical protein Gferi_01200 [Geosporobacter ferrireducens]|uniref:Uncharacterized protein n=1 Tax=Geosporobacter ferrireducens TaxID=1424294 RepID=A0A1D8GBQ0_9FIRM|nr:hypothetical protein Gferi_01200 [Geosporobacter ferrireducens]